MSAGMVMLATFATLLVLFAPALNAQRVGDRVAASRDGSQGSGYTRQDAATESYEVGGVKVVHRHGMANDVVAANLYLLGGTRLTSAGRSGIEPMLLMASERGTARYPREAVRLAMAAQGTSIVIDAESDWTMFGARATTGTFDSTFVVLADRIMNPTLEEREVEQVRSQLLNAVRQRRDSPDALLEYLADSVAYPGHHYAIPPSGTEESLAAITVEDLKNFQRDNMVSSRMLLVIVGNVERADVERLIASTLGTLPKGDYSWTMPPPPPDIPSSMYVEARPLPTNYILGYFNGPPASSSDYAALRIASAVLGGRLFHEVRVRRNLTYAIDVPFVERSYASGGLYVTTVSPDTVMAMMRIGIEELQTGRIDPGGLAQLVQGFIVQYFMDNETNADQADFLARAQVYRGDWRSADRFVDELRAVTPGDIQRVARGYMHDVRFAYIGDPRRIREEMAAIF